MAMLVYRSVLNMETPKSLASPLGQQGVSFGPTTPFAPKPGLHPRPQPAQLNATPGEDGLMMRFVLGAC